MGRMYNKNIDYLYMVWIGSNSNPWGSIRNRTADSKNQSKPIGLDWIGSDYEFHGFLTQSYQNKWVSCETFSKTLDKIFKISNIFIFNFN